MLGSILDKGTHASTFFHTFLLLLLLLLLDQETFQNGLLLLLRILRFSLLLLRLIVSLLILRNWWLEENFIIKILNLIVLVSLYKTCCLIFVLKEGTCPSWRRILGKQNRLLLMLYHALLQIAIAFLVLFGTYIIAYLFHV